MSDLSIQGAKGRTKITTTRSDRYKKVSSDLVQRNFVSTGPDALWVSDLTYIKTKEGWLYLVCVMDAFSRRILGSAIGETKRNPSYSLTASTGQKLQGKKQYYLQPFFILT